MDMVNETPVEVVAEEEIDKAEKEAEISGEGTL